MTTRRVWTWALVAAVALMAAPVGAQDLAPNTIWGQVPQGLSGHVGSAVLVDANGSVVANAPLVGGRFDFLNVTPGDYSVQLKDAAGKTLAESPKATLVPGGVLKVQFTGDSIVGGGLPHGGVPTTLIVAGGAVIVGVGTAIVIDQSNKNKSPESPKK